MMKIPINYYLNENVVDIAKDLLGKIIFTQIDNEITSGKISETEAYNGIKDKACHAYKGKRTKRTETMYHNGGVAYIYLCYGMHHLINIVTSNELEPKAVLIRAIVPLKGVDTMLKRRNKIIFTNQCNNGPGKISKSLGITTKLNGETLNGGKIWLEDNNTFIREQQIVTTTRIGINFAKEDALLPYRFLIK